MKKHISRHLFLLTKDPVLIGFLIGSVVVMLFGMISLGLQIVPSELQIATRYTAFGETQYYRDQWHYLLTGFIYLVVVLVVQTLFVVKLIKRDMHEIARLVALIGLLMICVSVAMLHAIFGVAYLT